MVGAKETGRMPVSHNRLEACVTAFAHADSAAILRLSPHQHMPLSPKLSPDIVEANMREIAPRYTAQEALVESSRCLFCFDAPCIAACPTGIDVPSFIKKITTSNLTGSARTILSANILGASCARVCPTEVLCEGACVMLDREAAPVKIGRLQRHATDHVYDNGTQLFNPPTRKSGKRVAIVGGGPAGLGCAA